MLLELAPQFQSDPATLSMLYFKGTGPLVPLDTLATVKQQIGPQTHQPRGPATLDDDLVRPGARRIARNLSHARQ